MFLADDSIFLIFLYRSSLSLCCLACIACVVFELFLCWGIIFCLLPWTVSGLLTHWGVHRWLFLLWIFLILKTFQGFLNCVIQYLLDLISTAIKELVNPQACYGSSICPPQNTVDLSSLLGYNFEIGLYIEISRLKYFVPSFELKPDQTHWLWQQLAITICWPHETLGFRSVGAIRRITTDRYGRTVGELFTETRNVGQYQVMSGPAVISHRHVSGIQLDLSIDVAFAEGRASLLDLGFTPSGINSVTVG